MTKKQQSSLLSYVVIKSLDPSRPTGDSDRPMRHAALALGLGLRVRRLRLSTSGSE